MQKIYHYLFAPRFTLNRFQLNLVGLFFISIGLVAGSYLTLKGITKIFAAPAPWTQTDWSSGVGASTTNQYSSASSIDATTTAGQLTLTNTEKLTNTDFETNLTSWDSFSATGGTITTSGGYTIHTFTSSGTFTPNGAANVEYLVVGGGGGGGGGSQTGGYTGGGGGGAGGLLSGSLAVTSSALTVTIGAGGSGGVFSITDNSGVSGSNSTFSTVTALGGGGGGAGGDLANAARIGKSGSSGGGSGYRSLVGGSGTAGQGFTGGSAGSQEQGSGGGGGAGAVGGTGLQTPYQYMGGAGGVGLSSSISGTSIVYAGGGGGGGLFLGTYLGHGGNAGTGGGGIGGYNVSSVGVYSGTNGAANSGGGGGGGTRHSVSNVGGNGGSGTVIIRYPALTATRDTITTYTSSAGSAKLVNGDTALDFTQAVNVGDTNTYNLTAYVYTTGAAVSSADAELFYNGATLPTTYTSVGSGWYKLSGTLTGANASRNYGVQVKANKTVYVDNFSLNSYASSGTLTSNIFDSNVGGSYWGILTYNSSGSTVTVKARSSNSSTMSGATAFSSCTAISSGSDISSNNCMTDGQQYIQYQITLTSADTSATPTVNDISTAFSPYDIIAPPTNASSITMATASSGGRSVASNDWNNAVSPYFSWTAGEDDGGGSGLKGYCVYLGATPSSDPSTTAGLLTNSPVATTGTTCGFITSSTTLDLSSASYLSSALVSGTTYFVDMKAIDNGNNVFTGSSASFQFRQDATSPTNVTSISTPGSSFSNVVDMSFTWPITGGTAASDSNSGVLGYQYQINSNSGAWLGTQTDSLCSVSYIPAATATYALTNAQDGAGIVAGNNTVYFRTVDTACNTSSSSTHRTGLLLYGGAAPTFGGSDAVTVAPSTSTSNSFAFSWPAATPGSGRSITHYYYMVNTAPPSTLATITSNTATYIDTSTARTVAARTMSGAVKGSNTVYVVAVDDQSNYSPSNVITGTFTLNSTLPDPPTNVSASDASIKASSLWRASLAWGAPAYTGTGSLTYKVQRGTDGVTWTDVTTTSGTAYVDTVATSSKFYWRVGSYDTSSASIAAPSYTNAVTLTPKGTFSAPADLSSGPTVSAITTKKATITWATSRTSDSKISYGTASDTYGSVDASSTDQVTAHSIILSNLSAGTTYYYKAKWSDEDGNTGTSAEKTFSTSPKPSIKEATAKNIGLTSAIVQFTTNGASSVKIYYGKSTSFGAVKAISTSTAETTYTEELASLDDGTKYYYKINTFDSDGSEYEGDTNSFQTLPRPKISNVRVQQVSNTAQSTLLVSWTTNTEASSIVTYFPEGDVGAARDEVNVALLKGEHKLILRGLLPQTNYSLIVRGRDKIGNEAVSDIQKVTTATDTRPPQISELKVEGSNVSIASSTGQEQQAQLVVSWNTDEPSTSQVEFGEGTGTTYAQKTQEDSSAATNHLVIISGLTPSKVYHLRALSKDKVGNQGISIDMVAITPKATDNAFNLVIQNLQEVFGFLGGLNK